MTGHGSSDGLHVADVSVVYAGLPALDSVSLGIAPGEAVAFVGPSGAGKTTLLRVLNATVRPTSGCVTYRGEHLGELSANDLRAVRGRIGFVHQSLGLVPNLRVIQNVMAGRLGRQGLLQSLRAFVRPKPAEIEHAYEILERVGIPEKLYERTDRLSGGQQQRVAIARALYQDPEMLLADEPVSSVDPARARDTVKLLTEISSEQGLTLCMSLHNLDLARDYFPRLVGLRNGKIAFDAPVGEVDPDEFQRLYDLEQGEMLADGA